MTQTSIPFLQRLHDEAEQNGYITVDLPEQQGIIVLPQNCSRHEQIDLLQQQIITLRSTQGSPSLAENSPVSTDIDCQVTVEERTQLFKFLQI